MYVEGTGKTVLGEPDLNFFTYVLPINKFDDIGYL